MKTAHQTISVIKTDYHPLHFYKNRISLSDLSAALHETLRQRSIPNLQSILPAKRVKVHTDAGVKNEQLPHEIHDVFLDLRDAKQICREFCRFDIEAEIINWQVAMNPEVQSNATLPIQSLREKHGVRHSTDLYIHSTYLYLTCPLPYPPLALYTLILYFTISRH